MELVYRSTCSHKKSRLAHPKRTRRHGSRLPAPSQPSSSPAPPRCVARWRSWPKRSVPWCLKAPHASDRRHLPWCGMGVDRWHGPVWWKGNAYQISSKTRTTVMRMSNAKRKHEHPWAILKFCDAEASNIDLQIDASRHKVFVQD